MGAFRTWRGAGRTRRGRLGTLRGPRSCKWVMVRAKPPHPPHLTGVCSVSDTIPGAEVTVEN